DKMAAADTAALLSLMEGGRLVRAKVGRRLDEQFTVWVVAATNNLRVLSPELLSRFAQRRLQPYTRQEFRMVVKGVLARREGIPDDVAERVAANLDGRTQDVRDAVRVARMSSQVSVERAIELLGL
ncbi:MAG: AAA family ATPase, partial [Chloroflexota bacterium]|nr:AAA family ATPase [Chloroflexota bacterium]